MKRRATCWIIFSIMIMLNGYNLEAAEKQGPLVKIASSEFDFGSVNEGAVIRHTFIVSNGGDELLEIKKVVPG